MSYSTLVFDQVSFWLEKKLKLKKNKHKCNLHYAAMPMMTSQILKSVNFTETQKSRYLENEILFSSSNKKKLLITHQGLLYNKK